MMLVHIADRRIVLHELLGEFEAEKTRARIVAADDASVRRRDVNGSEIALEQKAIALLRPAQLFQRAAPLGDLAHQLFGPLRDALLQRAVQRLELRARSGDAIEHQVEGAGKMPDFVFAFNGGAATRRSRRETLRGIGNAAQRTRDQRAKGKHGDGAERKREERRQRYDRFAAARLVENVIERVANDQRSNLPSV